MEEKSRARIPTPWGELEMVAYAESASERMPHLALIKQPFQLSDSVLVRIHSECLTGDLFSSNRCECGAQLRSSLDQIAQEGGVVIYLRQEGRGIGLIEKLKAYGLQDKGLNTVDANVELGHAPDARSYDLALEILEDLGIKSIRLLTNNPDKIKTIEESNITLLERVPLVIESNGDNERYMETKKDLLGHLLD